MTSGTPVMAAIRIGPYTSSQSERPGGKLGLASWTPEGFLGDFFRAASQLVPPPAGLPSPFLWGTEAGLSALFGSDVRVLTSERKHFVFRYRSAAHFIEVFRAYYGPTHQAFKTLDEQGQKALRDRARRVSRSRTRKTLTARAQRASRVFINTT
jgi:hypothetical protein